MIQKEDLERFRSYVNSGGLVTAGNLVNGRRLKTLCEGASASLSATVNSSADYTRDEIQALPEAILSLAGGLSTAASRLGPWNDYLVAATTQEDLNIVALGVEVIRLLAGEENTTPAPSMLPITSKSELEALEVEINRITAEQASISALMSQINAVLVVVQPEPPAPPVTVPDLPPELIVQAQAKANELQPLIGLIEPVSAVIEQMATDASQERLLAHERFKEAVQFTIGEGQLKNPAISDAAKEIYTI